MDLIQRRSSVRDCVQLFKKDTSPAGKARTTVNLQRDTRVLIAPQSTCNCTASYRAEGSQHQSRQCTLRAPPGESNVWRSLAGPYLFGEGSQPELRWHIRLTAVPSGSEFGTRGLNFPSQTPPVCSGKQSLLEPRVFLLDLPHPRPLVPGFLEPLDLVLRDPQLPLQRECLISNLLDFLNLCAANASDREVVLWSPTASDGAHHANHRTSYTHHHAHRANYGCNPAQSRATVRGNHPARIPHLGESIKVEPLELEPSD